MVRACVLPPLLGPYATLGRVAVLGQTRSVIK
jgi:hypothetical protein